jgi:chorismate lyase/3-hydroxybenzoate synthase
MTLAAPTSGLGLALTNPRDGGRPQELPPPAWVADLVGAIPRWHDTPDIHCQSRGRFTLVAARVRDVPELTCAEFESRTYRAYAAIAARLRLVPAAYPVRFWNYVPSITGTADAERNNYMVFNAGRYRGFTAWYGDKACFDRHVATASAIGHRGADLVIHCLAADSPGSALNNPRQVAPYHYSQRFGPLPPCFARAMWLSSPHQLLLVGGTSSVRGEDSVHRGDLAGQCRESLLNLAAVIGVAAGQKFTGSVPLANRLKAFSELRVYFPRPEDEPQIASLVRKNFPGLRRAELLRADLCRTELLIEIEGIANLTELSRAAPSHQAVR